MTKLEGDPIKVGVLMDYGIGDSWGRDDFLRSLELTFEEGFKAGIVDRPVEMVYREVDGLPRGSVKAVIDAFGELVDEGCLAVHGPVISDNAVAVRDAIEERFHVPAISLCGAEDWMGEWTFGLPNGSMTDEPILWAHLLRKNGQSTVGVMHEVSYVGQNYLANFRRAVRYEGIQIVAEEAIPQTAQDITEQVRVLKKSGAQALVHCGFGLGVARVNEALEALDWDPPRYMGTALETGYEDAIRDNFVGWIGLEQFDEENEVATKFLDRFEAKYGYRPEYCTPVFNHDAAQVLLQAFGDASPLSPRGVKEALERVKMLPAASGAPGTRISFGKWCRRGWMGAGYLVARTLRPDGVRWESTLVGRYGQD